MVIPNVVVTDVLCIVDLSFLSKGDGDDEVEER
jgi:hypothetical protein